MKNLPSELKYCSVTRRLGFTLVELLTVMAIVAILLSLLLPAISNIRQSAQSANCAGNLRAIGAAFHLYAAENNNLFPATGYRFRSTESDDGKNPTHGNWQVEIDPYLGKGVSSFFELRGATGRVERYAVCPTFLPKLTQDEEYFQNKQAAGYGMNPGLARVDVNNNGIIQNKPSWDYRFNPMLIKDAPSKVILAGDSDLYYLILTRDMAPNEEGYYFDDLGAFVGAPSRHMQKANYLFIDGHVETLALEQAVEFFENYSPW